RRAVSSRNAGRGRRIGRVDLPAAHLLVNHPRRVVQPQSRGATRVRLAGAVKGRRPRSSKNSSPGTRDSCGIRRRGPAAIQDNLAAGSVLSCFSVAVGKGEETRLAVLDQAVEVARRVGLSGLTIGSLAEQAHLSKSGLFGHFNSKEALQLQVLERARER